MIQGTALNVAQMSPKYYEVSNVSKGKNGAVKADVVSVGAVILDAKEVTPVAMKPRATGLRAEAIPSIIYMMCARVVAISRFLTQNTYISHKRNCNSQ